MVLVWSIDPVANKFTLKYQFDGHDFGVAHLAWSPDSRYLIACGPDDCADLWLWDCQVC